MPDNKNNDVNQSGKGVRKRVRKKKNKFIRIFKNNFNIFLAIGIVLATVLVGIGIIVIFETNNGIKKELNNENTNESSPVSSKRVFSQNISSNSTSINDNTPLKRQCIVSFIDDDGSNSAFNKLSPIFEEKQVPYTISIITNLSIGKITPENMAIANQLGYEFVSHTLTNPKLYTLTKENMEKEFRESKEWIEKAGYKCKALVYPSGELNALSKLVAKKYYDFAFINGANDNSIPIDPYSLKRVAMGANFDPFDQTNDIFKDTSLLEYYQSRVDIAYASDNWLIFTLRANDQNFTKTQQNYLRQLIDYIKVRDIKILTVSEAYEYFKK